jgi:hypothetical protein
VLLALATLVLLPGLLVVRAPWTAVPALSLAFWALSAWWPPLASASRERVTLAALLVFAPLVLLRFVPKHEVPPPPGTLPRPAHAPPPRRGCPPTSLLSAESAFVLAAALAVALPGLAWRNAPGPDGAFQATAARLFVWRDAIPAGLDPLLPLAPFGAHAPALATLAGDVARLSGGDPAPAVALVVAAAVAAVLVGLFALHATWAGPRVAALGAIVGLAVAPWPWWLSGWGAANAVLALAFLLPAVALAVAHASRASAVAAGFLLAAGALAQPVLALGASAVVASPWLGARVRTGGLSRRAAARRLGLVLGSALAFGLPGLWPLAHALSWSEAVAVVGALRPAEAAWFAAGLAALLFGPAAVAPLARADRRLAGAAALLGAALLVVRVHGWMAAGQLSAAEEAALRGASRGGVRLEALCAPDALRDWVPAIAARPAGEPGPWIPPAYREEWQRRPKMDCVPLSR